MFEKDLLGAGPVKDQRCSAPKSVRGSSTRRAVEARSKSRWCVSPCFDLISAPLFTIKYSSEGMARQCGGRSRIAAR